MVLGGHGTTHNANTFSKSYNIFTACVCMHTCALMCLQGKLQLSFSLEMLSVIGPELTD